MQVNEPKLQQSYTTTKCTQAHAAQGYSENLPLKSKTQFDLLSCCWETYTGIQGSAHCKEQKAKTATTMKSSTTTATNDQVVATTKPKELDWHTQKSSPTSRGRNPHTVETRQQQGKANTRNQVVHTTIQGNVIGKADQ